MFVYLEAIRFFKPQGTLLLYIPSLIALSLFDLSYDISIYIYLIFLAGAFFVRSAACIINDIYDVEFDKRVSRTMSRPLASGRVSKIKLLIFLLLLLSLALLCLLQLSKNAIIAGAFAPVLFFTYPLFKRFTFFPQLFLGVCMSYGVVIASFHVEGKLSMDMLILFLGMAFWTFAYDTIYAYQDINDDKVAGVKSSALLFGLNGKRYLYISYLLFLMSLMYVFSSFGLGFYQFFLINVLGVYIYARLQFLSLSDPDHCAEEFSQNVYYGLVPFLIVFVSNVIS
jgi:4-hydroxybenzoate polyprenyltransferase